MEIKTLYDLKRYLKAHYPNVEDIVECLKFIEGNCELVDSSESLDDYFEYILPYQLSTESQSNEYTRKMSVKAKDIIDKWKSNGNEDEFKNIQVKQKEVK